MGSPSCVLQVDDQRFLLDFQGFDQPLEAWNDTRHLRLIPWTLEQHLRALGAALRVKDGRLSLETETYADQVLEGVPEAASWRSLALWWAAGGGDEGPPPDRPATRAPAGAQGVGWRGRDGDPFTASGDPPRSGLQAERSGVGDEGSPPNNMNLPDGHYALRAWTWAERSAALDRCVMEESLDVPAYLRELLTASVRVLAGASPLHLPSDQSRQLLGALSKMNDGFLPRQTPDSAARLLHLCRSLGWSPSQVLATPAAEIDRLMELLERVKARPQAPRAEAPRPEPSRVTTASRGSLLSGGGSFLIQIDDA